MSEDNQNSFRNFKKSLIFEFIRKKNFYESQKNEYNTI